MTRQTVTRMLFVSVVVALASGAAACGGTAQSAASAEQAEAAVPLAPENVVTASAGELTAGPAISGELTPAREATVRAQVGGSIERLTVDRGQPVRAGMVLARIASRDLEEALASAETGVRSAESALALAQSEARRTATLVEGGALAARDLEQATLAVSNAESALAAARARARSAGQQIEDTTIRAPFAGVVSARAANLGDIVTPGAAILTVIDPSSLRLEALVPSSEIGRVRPDAEVVFTVRGVPGRTFIGTVTRVSPAADPVTRQVPIFVSLPNVEGDLLAGLFAEGRIQAETREGIVVPIAAVDETGAVPMVTRVREGRAERVAVELGVRQVETERVEIVTGVAPGDVLILGSAKAIAPGTPVRLTDNRPPAEL